MRSVLPLLALALAALAIPASAATDAATLSLTIHDHQFDPTELDAPAGQKIELHVKNTDPAPAEFESSQLHREKVVPAGQEIVVPLGPLSPGSYEFFDDFHRSTRGRMVVH
jgi:plastocyanin